MGQACPCGSIPHEQQAGYHLPPDTISLAVPGFKPSGQSVSRLCSQLGNLNLTEIDTVVLDLLSNSAYLGTSDNGLPAEPERGDGSLMIAPAAYLKRILKICQPVGCCRGESRHCAGLPNATLCYWQVLRRSQSYKKNFDEKDFDDCIVNGTECSKMLLNTWGTEHGVSPL